jgi:hypothetical protein
VYAFYFSKNPPTVAVENCISCEENILLYVGIAPRKSVTPSHATLRTRIPFHLWGNAYGSTLRLSLGCLLTQSLGLRLQAGSGGKGLTFGQSGENLLSQWISENTLLTWATLTAPWTLEEYLLQTISLPLNLQGNKNHPFNVILKNVRKRCRAEAK